MIAIGQNIIYIYIYIYILVGGLEYVLFFHILGDVIIPTDQIIFSRGVGQPPNIYIYIYKLIPLTSAMVSPIVGHSPDFAKSIKIHDNCLFDVCEIWGLYQKVQHFSIKLHCPTGHKHCSSFHFETSPETYPWKDPYLFFLNQNQSPKLKQ